MANSLFSLIDQGQVFFFSIPSLHVNKPCVSDMKRFFSIRNTYQRLKFIFKMVDTVKNLTQFLCEF